MIEGKLARQLHRVKNANCRCVVTGFRATVRFRHIDDRDRVTTGVAARVGIAT